MISISNGRIKWINSVYKNYAYAEFRRVDRRRSSFVDRRRRIDRILPRSFPRARGSHPPSSSIARCRVLAYSRKYFVGEEEEGWEGGREGGREGGTTVARLGSTSPELYVTSERG